MGFIPVQYFPGHGIKIHHLAGHIHAYQAAGKVIKDALVIFNGISNHVIILAKYTPQKSARAVRWRRSITGARRGAKAAACIHKKL